MAVQYYTYVHCKKISEANKGKKMPEGALSKAWTTRRANLLKES